MKRRAEAAQEVEGEPFFGSTVFGGPAEKKTNELQRRRGNMTSAGPTPLIIQIMDLLEGYLDNIYAVATQIFAKGGPLAELAASLAISVDTVARQQQEIKCLYKQINALKNRGRQAASIRTLPRGGLV